ncbi:MAG: hypothetical protein EOO38_14020, partial [Cytophagaceae bacterium]
MTTPAACDSSAVASTLGAPPRQPTLLGVLDRPLTRQTVQRDLFHTVVKAALDYASYKGGAFLDNCEIAFRGSEASAERLAGAVRWLSFYCNFDQPNTPEDVLRNMAAVALEVHDLFGRRNWEAIRREANFCFGGQIQERACEKLIVLFAGLPTRSCQDLAEASSLWVRVPEFLHECLEESYSDVVNLEKILRALVAEQPSNSPEAVANVSRASAIIEANSDLEELRAVVGNLPRSMLSLLAPEIRSLDAHQVQCIKGKQRELSALLDPLRGSLSATSLNDFLARERTNAPETRCARLRKEVYAKISKPNEGGASRVREEQLRQSVFVLQEKLAKWYTRSQIDGVCALGEIRAHIAKVPGEAFDKPNIYGHTPRQKAEHALLSLCHLDTNGALLPPPIYNGNKYKGKNELSQFGLIALAWKAASKRSRPAELLKYNFVMALARCLDDEQERFHTLPSINCWRGYAEQLIMIFAGWG